MNRTLLSLLCYFAIADLCKAQVSEEILEVIRIEDENRESLLSIIAEQLQHKGTDKEWGVILDRIKQIKSKLKIDVKIRFQNSPSWCLYTPETQMNNEKGNIVITFAIQYDAQQNLWNRPVFTVQHMLQAVTSQDQTILTTNILHCILPPYIMLSHEMLHMLLRLDYILASRSLPDVQSKIADIKKGDLKLFNEFLDARCPQMVSLMRVNKAFLELWGVGEIPRDELMVILGGIYTIETETLILGETQFLREHYGDPNIISWTHFLFEMISNAESVITHRRFLDNAFQLDCVARCLEAFPFLRN